jgi:hypothetical protein
MKGPKKEKRELEGQADLLLGNRPKRSSTFLSPVWEYQE